MKAQDAFGVIVRAAGFGCVLAGILNLLYSVTEIFGLVFRPGLPAGRILTGAAIWILVGLAVLAGASRIVSLIYGRDNSG